MILRRFREIYRRMCEVDVQYEEQERTEDVGVEREGELIGQSN